MPVHFKGKSEYDRHYVWRDSYRSKAFHPTREQNAVTAGLQSSLIVGVAEPSLQRKKRVPIRADQPFTMKPTMEPSLQGKKRVDPPFMKTTPVKSEFDGVPLQSKKRVPSPSHKPTPAEPIMQAKKRIVPDFAKTAPVEPIKETNVQSKKKVEHSHTEKPLKDNIMQSKKKVEHDHSSEKPIQSEPPLQSKRRTPGPTTSLTNGFYDNGIGRQEEYALLGNQDKFSENVKYRPRSAYNSRDISPPKQMKLQKKSKENRDPIPAPVVNVDKFKKPPTPLAPRQPKKSDPAFQEIKESNLRKEPKVTRSPKQSRNEPVLSKTRNEEDKEMAEISEPKQEKVTAKEPKSDKGTKEPSVSKVEKVQESEVRLSAIKGEEVKNLDQGDPVKESMKAKKIIGNMNEFAQTDMDKGIADSAPEAPADYALRYKTGISAPRPTKKVSEYQKQFQWKGGPPASPLLKAEQDLGPKQVVYNSCPQLSPPKKSVIPKVTEYQKQFKAYKLVPVPKEEMEEAPKKKTKLQKSQSMEDLSPAEIKPAGSSPVISPDNRRLTLESDQKKPEPVPEVPKKKSRQVRSEYKSNFKEPERFDYVRGTWHGAAPPQVRIKGPEETVKAPALANWFAEVIELRRKAQEYRQRALGTHFSREHMAQLMAKQNDLWEASTPTARSTLSALSLESGLSSHRGEPKNMGRGRGHVSTAATLASEDDQSTARLDEVAPQGQKKQAWADEEEQMDRMSQETPSTFSAESPGFNGRVPTPKIREQILTGDSQHRRHHLDRTTPSVGGAILSSPPDSKKKRSGKRIVSRSVDSISLGTVEDETPRQVEVQEHQPLAGQKTYQLCSTTPTFGMPSRDTHALRDEDASTDRELHTQFVYTPAKPKAKDTPGGLSAIDEGFGQTYNKPKSSGKKMRDFSWTIDGGLPIPRIDEDDGVLSVSMQSMASSCSLASDTLERARKRKEEFWGQHTVKAK
ncbi:nuclear protein MDM1-like isoform X5 [Mercenaria mercenaria]|uniref:nuclear protein MDM1-like isoform X5 n=1 Tax=Mercenaria mercenaria TaxID=6596 RepID=UPI00234E8549|nr:nuclear protein MDM1-like isoform X5 [Mercenaria mercenaria]